jgi:hypothetical protein
VYTTLEQANRTSKITIITKQKLTCIVVKPVHDQWRRCAGDTTTAW